MYLVIKNIFIFIFKIERIKIEIVKKGKKERKKGATQVRGGEDYAFFLLLWHASAKRGRMIIVVGPFG